nr:hypothetical protein HUO10_004787 [Paraburkholderia busanensis]
MKLLRILTGRHAGAQVHLDPGAYRIGADDDADIQLTDWRGADVLLVVEANGAVSSQRLDTGAVHGEALAGNAATPAGSPVDSEAAAAQRTDAEAQANVETNAVAEAEAEAAEQAETETATEAKKAHTESRRHHENTAAPDAPPAHDAQAPSAATLDPGKVWMVDFVPMQFDDTVVCIGWADATWPSDLALLSTLLSAPVQAQREADDAERDAARLKRRRYTGIAVACLAITAGAIGISFALTTNVSRAALTPPDVLLEQRVNRALSDAHLDELHAVRDGTNGSGGAARAVVTGMVRSESEDYIARQVFEHMKPGVIARRYRLADETARGIRDAIGVDGVQVTYNGNGVFTVSGAVADRQRVENALTRVRGDFDKSITQIRVALTDVSRPETAPRQGTYTALVSSGDVQYAETPDGVKHIYAVPDVASDAAADAAASGPATTNAPAALTALAGPATTNATAATPATPTATTVANATTATTASTTPGVTRAARAAPTAVAGPVPLPSDDGGAVPLPH